MKTSRPHARIDPQNPRPEVGDQILAPEQARGDEKTARHEQHVEAHFAERKPEPVEEEFAFRREPQHRDAVREQHRHGGGKTEEREVVVPPDGVIGEPHERSPRAGCSWPESSSRGRAGGRGDPGVAGRPTFPWIASPDFVRGRNDNSASTHKAHSAARTGRSGAESRWTLRRSATMKAISIDCSALRRGSQ